MKTLRNKKILDEIDSIEKAHDWFDFAKESKRDSDRGCALLLASMLESHIEKLLRST
jgi:hypothetical protein